MTDVSDVDELGPVDYVVEFPGSQFNGEIAPGPRRPRGLVAFPSRPCSPRSKLTTKKRKKRKEPDMPLAARRMRPAVVIGPAPVARTATTVATAAVVAHGVNRRTDRRDYRGDRRR
jgi:hypothetical protein